MSRFDLSDIFSPNQDDIKAPPELIKALTERFWSYVDKKSNNDCWMWKGYVQKDGKGYGVFQVCKRPRKVHRISYVIYKGPIPEGMEVMHQCPNGDNKLCVNPNHLELGTKEEHIIDRVKKGQSPKGARNVKAKLTEEQVLDIRYLREKGVQLKCICKLYKMSQPQITSIIRRNTWKHI